MLNFKSHIAIKVGSEKNFGITFSFIFFVVACYLFAKLDNFFILALIASLLFLVIAFFIPRVFTIPNLLWFKFGVLLGSITAPIALAFIYFSVVLITGIIMRVLGKDLMRLKIDKSVETYWVRRTVPVGSMKNQF